MKRAKEINFSKPRRKPKFLIETSARACREIDHVITRSIRDLLARIHKPLAITGGSLLGYLYGAEFAPMIDQYTANLLLHHVPLTWWEVISRGICTLVGGVSAAFAVDHHTKLYELRRSHHDIFGKYYKIARPTGNWITDLLWAYLAGAVIAAGSFSAATFVWPILPFLISTNWLVVGLLLIVLAAGWEVISMSSKAILTEMFKPRRLEYEIKNAGLLIPVLERALAARQKAKTQEINENDKEVRDNDW